MQNLLHASLSKEAVQKILSTHPLHPILPPLDSSPWKKAASNPLLQSLKNQLRELAEKEADQPLPPLTLELYSTYSRTGNRWEFEVVYFERRRQLARAALSLLLSDETDSARALFGPSLLAKLIDIFEEISWALPAHVKASTGQDPLEIDLFCAETANLMAEMLDLFDAIIPSELKHRILTRLRTQVWENYLEKNKSGSCWWINGGNNWNAVCHQGVIGSALAACDDNDLLAQMLMVAREGLPKFLAGFGQDGGSSEGPGYWDYGFGWYAVLNEQLEARTKDQLSLVADDPQVLEIARFGPRVSLSGGQLLGFADTYPIGFLRPANLTYLGQRLDDSLCRNQGLSNYAQLLKQGLDVHFQRMDLLYLVRFILRAPEQLPDKLPVVEKDVYLKDLAIVIVSGTDSHGHLWELAAKGGHNLEHHNHNDCGSYTLNIDSVRFVTEIGMPLYNREFFGPNRYQNIAARTLGHSLPIINGCEQVEGFERAAVTLEHSNSPTETRFVLDLTACYPAEAACKKLIRTFHLEKTKGQLTVRDEFDLAEVRSAETAIITIHPVKPEKDSVTITADNLNLLFKLDQGTTFAGIEEHTYQHHNPMLKDPQPINRIVLKPATLRPQFTLGYTAQLS
jgi:hypothetical protein